MNLLDIDKAKDEQRLISEEVNDTVMEHVTAGVEIISGKRGSQYFGVTGKKQTLGFPNAGKMFLFFSCRNCWTTTTRST